MKLITWVICLVWLGTMTWLQGISRAEFTLLWSVFTLAFCMYACLLSGRIRFSLHTGLILALLARLISFFFEPLLSDDYFRFIWDGMLILQGVHPMAYTPSFLIQHPGTALVDSHLYGLLNSQNYYSVYPPAAQWFFGISYRINGLSLSGHILFYKLLLTLADAVVVYLLYLLLKQKQLPTTRLLIYALNPLLIIEYTGNLHMDGIMIAALLGAVVLSDKKNVVWSSLLMTLSIVSKMLTLILIPFMPKRMYWGRISAFGFLSACASALIFWLSFGAHTGWIESVRLWFHSFEFNASIYYIVRSLGYLVKGYNIISYAGPALAIITIGGIVWLWWSYIRKPGAEWSTAMLAVLTLYFLMSTTVHPWYLGSILALSIVSRHTYPVIWTFLVFLSYSHYTGGVSEENYWLIGIEYLLLFSWILWEWWQRKSRNSMAINN